MLHKRQFAVAGFVGLLLLLLALSWVCGRGEPPSRSLRFKLGDDSIRPLFVLLTRGRLETNNNWVAYVHPPFYQRWDPVGPISALNYSVRNWMRDRLSRLGFRRKFNRLGAGMTGPMTNPYPYMLRFGFRDPKTNEVFFQDAYLEADGGSRLPLRHGGRETRYKVQVDRKLMPGSRLPLMPGNRAMVLGQSLPEYVDTYFLPSPLTNRGTYRLVVRPNRTLVSFVY